jgi:tetrapyrrole methylase family protein/MazG family protein
MTKKSNGITLLGLGPGNPQLLTRQAWDLLNNLSAVYLRTKQHPVVSSLPDSLIVHSFDDLYQTSESFEEVYSQIVEQVLDLGMKKGGVVYAVPGHPFIAEATCPEIYRRAKEIGIPVDVVDGLSFLEPVISAVGTDPFPHTALVDALELARLHVAPFPPSAPAIIAQIHSRAVASDVKLTLMATYPDEHAVILVHAAGTENELVEDMPLFEIDRSPHIGLLTALYVPPLGVTTSLEAFQEIIAHLRAPDGCPWDRKQTHQTLRSHLLEEAYEVLAALDADDPNAMREEFGDLLLQIVLHAQISSEYGEFGMAEILQSIHTKIVRRHPHVFGDLDLQDVEGVLHNWEKLKEAERAENGKQSASLLDGVALALPALVQAYEYQDRAARVGFDWHQIEGVYEKVREEIGEIQGAVNDVERAAELGDVLFAVVNLGRWLKVEPESALREANQRFRWRFSQIENAARAQGRSISDLSLDEMEALWQAAKRE